MEENNVQNTTQETAEQPLAKGMKKCKTCGAPIAKNAKRCPACGAKNKKPIYKRIWFWIVVIAVVVAGVNAIKRSGLDVKKPSAKLTADEFLKEFFEGDKKGDSKYKNTVVAITGQVGSVEEGYIRIDAFSHDFTLYTVHAKMADKGDLTKVTNGSVITVSGICDGSSFGCVEMSKCILDNSFAVNPDYNSATVVPIKDLMQEYSDNAVAADAKYWGKTVEITGEVRYIGSESKYVILVPEGFDRTLETVLDGIEVYFENIADYEKVKADAGPNALGGPANKITITVVGVCYGEAIGYDAHLCRAKLK